MKTLKLTAGLALGLLFGLMTIPQANATGPWSGCFVGANAGLVHGGFDAGGGVDVGAQGQTLGAAVGCDLQIDRIVIGGAIEYDRAFGKLHDFGINSDMTALLRAGVLLYPNVLVYGHGDWTRVQTGGLDFNGWKAGFGTEMKLPGYPQWTVDVRYSHFWADDIASSGINATADEVRVGMNFKFGAPAAVAAPLK